jgi:hypothetical protein
MDDSDNVSKLVHVVFTPSTSKHWIFRCLDPYFQHCYTVETSKGGQFWIITDSKTECLDVRIEAKSIYPTIRDLCPDSVILSTKVIIKPNSYRYTLCVFSLLERGQVHSVGMQRFR